MVLKAVLDESGNAPDQQLFVMGGLLSTERKWLLFSQEWTGALEKTATTPAVKVVKFSEITRMRGQFAEERGWTIAERDKRLELLVDIILRRCLCYVSVSMRWDLFDLYVRSEPAGTRTLLNDAPNVTVALESVEPVVQALIHFKLVDRCNFRFDESDGHADLIQHLWPWTRQITASIPEEFVRRTKPNIGWPRFDSEQNLRPLQGADLIAGMVRQVRLDGTTHPAFKPLEKMWSRNTEMTEDRLRRIGEGIRNHAAWVQKTFPGEPLYGYDPKTAKKTRRSQEAKRRREMERAGIPLRR